MATRRSSGSKNGGKPPAKSAAALRAAREKAGMDSMFGVHRTGQPHETLDHGYIPDLNPSPRRRKGR